MFGDNNTHARARAAVERTKHTLSTHAHDDHEPHDGVDKNSTQQVIESLGASIGPSDRLGKNFCGNVVYCGTVEGMAACRQIFYKMDSGGRRDV